MLGWRPRLVLPCDSIGVRGERAADQLMEALVGDDVLAIDQERWQAMAISTSPHWRAIRAQAIRLHPEP